MEQPSIEITYDPTIKVRGITEELFKQQPEGKFVLKPFTIISKKVYKNFNDRSHAFNYLLKFLKKKSKEDGNVVLEVFSEKGLFQKISWLSFLFIDSSKMIGVYLLSPLKFISSIKYRINTEDAIEKILTEAQNGRLKPFGYIYSFMLILGVSGSILIAHLASSILFENNYISFPLLFFILTILWGIVFGLSIVLLIWIFFKLEEKSPFIGKFFRIYFTLKELLYTIDKSKNDIHKITNVIINLNIYENFDRTTTLNFIKYLIKLINNSKSISIIFHVQNKYYINFIKKELITIQCGDKLSLLLEHNRFIEEIPIVDNSELKEENLPMHYNEYMRIIEQKRFEEFQHLEQKYKEQLARLIQSAKLESMNITTSGVSHEIRNPLSIIQLVIENLRIDKNLNREVLAEDLDKIQTQVSRIFKLTETFQKYSSQKNLTKKGIDSQITNSLSFFEQRLLSNKIEVNYEKPEERIGAIEFSEELSIVLENLISNSIDALVGNKDAIIRIKVSLEENKLCILFSDNGHGIPKEHLTEIFTPLFTTKGPGKGTGLGLWLCRKLITEDFKGNITVDSTPNEDTTFTILLPVDGDGNVQQ